MKRSVLLLLSALSIAVFAQTKPQNQAKPVVFTRVTVIDGTGARAQPDMTVVVTGNRISAIGKTGRVVIPEGAQIIDATGKFLIPGLWDMHVHGFEDRSRS